MCTWTSTSTCFQFRYCSTTVRSYCCQQVINIVINSTLPVWMHRNDFFCGCALAEYQIGTSSTHVQRYSNSIRYCEDVSTQFETFVLCGFIRSVTLVVSLFSFHIFIATRYSVFTTQNCMGYCLSICLYIVDITDYSWPTRYNWLLFFIIIIDSTISSQSFVVGPTRNDSPIW